MPRAAASGGMKRKADGPVAAPAKRARKMVGDTDGDGDGDGTTTATNASEESGGGMKRRAEDEESDVANTQHLLAIAEFGNRERRDARRETAKYVRALEKGMRKRREEMKKIKNGEMEAEETKNHAEFLDSFKAAHTLATPFAAHDALRKRSADLAARGRDLVEAFNHAVARVSALDATLTHTADAWGDEDAALARLLAAGKTVAERRREDMLARGGRAGRARLGGDEARAEEVLFGEAKKRRGAWGEVARAGEKAGRRLARAVERTRG